MRGQPRLAGRRARLEEEDVGALHAGVEDLRRAEVVRLGAAHDLRAAQHALQAEAARDAQQQRVVLMRRRVHLLSRAQEVHLRAQPAHRMRGPSASSMERMERQALAAYNSPPHTS